MRIIKGRNTSADRRMSVLFAELRLTSAVLDRIRRVAVAVISIFLGFTSSAVVGGLVLALAVSPAVAAPPLATYISSVSGHLGNLMFTPEDACKDAVAYFNPSFVYAYLSTGTRSGMWYCSMTRVQDNWTTEYGFVVAQGSLCADRSIPDVKKPLELQCGGQQFWSTGVATGAVREQSCSVGNPILTGTGIKVQQESDIGSPQSGEEAILRTFRSAYSLEPVDGFGSHWMHQWQRRLNGLSLEASSSTLFALRADGRTVKFSKSAGVWTATDGSRDRLEGVMSGTIRTGWKYIDAETDSVEAYDASGRLVSVTARDGRTTTLSYSDAKTLKGIAPDVGMLIAVRGWSGRTLGFVYDSARRIISITSSDGSVTRYAYGANGILANVTWPDTRVRSYHYEDSRFPWALTGITDESGVRFATYAYDAEGRATGTEHAGGVDKFQLSFLGNGQTSVTTGDATSRIFGSELRGAVLRATGASASCPACGDVAKTVTYDAAGNVASRRDFADKETRYSYDALGRETQRVEGYGTTDAKTTTTEWHPTWNLPLKVAAPGRVDYFSYDSKGQVLTYGWYPSNDAVGSQGLNAQPSGDVTSTTWTYDANGLVATAVDKLGDTVTGQWTFTYDAQGNLVSVTNMAGQTGTAVQYDAAGRLLEAVDVNGSRIKYSYDARGRMTDLDIDGIHTKYEYDAVGQLVGIAGPYDLVTRYTYDAAHRLIQILDNITIPEMGNDSSLVSPFTVEGSAPPSSLAYVSGRLASGWNAVVRWLKDWLSGIISAAHAQTAPSLPNSYAPPLRPGQSMPAYPGSSAAPDLDPSLKPEKATPGMYVMQFLVKVQKACGEVLDAVVSSFDKSTPPGDCDDDEYTKLKTNVDQSCKTGQQYCKAGDSATLLASKRDALQVCANARRKIMNVCFRGGDKIHQREWVKVVQQVDICNGL